MLVSLDWLRSLCGFDASSEDVARALTDRGLTVDAVSTAGDDTVIELDVPANRPDCLGHVGVARELGAAFDTPLAERPVAPPAAGEAVEATVTVRIEDPDLCPRYTARIVRGVRVGPSPDWVVRRLEACGLRSINNVVDASNLVLLELGSPIHFFDLSLVRQSTIVVRRAHEGERLTTLDDVERKLEPDMLLIADPERAVALAGVIGGADSEIHDATRDVLVEAAYFEPRSIRKTARRLGVRTDASHRFERGVDPEAVIAAQDMAARLLADLAGGTPAPGTVDAYPSPVPLPELSLRPERVELLLGYRPTDDEIAAALSRVELSPTRGADGRFHVRVPTWRVDLSREADLVEEVARHLGYDRIPGDVAGMSITMSPGRADAGSDVEERCRDQLAHAGFLEAFSYSMIGAGEDAPYVPEGTPPPVALSNPIAEPLANLRRSMLPGLIRSVDLNLRRGAEDARLFEVGRVFLDRGAGELPREPLRAGLAWLGAAEARHWSVPYREVALHDMAGVVDRLLLGLAPTLDTERDSVALAGLHPGKALRWKLPSGDVLGWCGALHPRLRAQLDLPSELLLAEIELDPLAGRAAEVALHRPLPRFPAVYRDLSLVVPRTTAFASIRAALETVPAPAPARLSVIDRYEGKPLDPAEVALTVRVRLQPDDRTLTDEETEAYRESLIARLRDDLGIRLRG
jgi:phenylalanyl-tRNA synthetase beta chain